MFCPVIDMDTSPVTAFCGRRILTLPSSLIAVPPYCDIMLSGVLNTNNNTSSVNNAAAIVNNNAVNNNSVSTSAASAKNNDYSRLSLYADVMP